MKESFQFRNFEPTDDIVLYASTMLAQIMELAPDDSTCVATIVKVKNDYFASLEIYYRSGHFFAEADAQDPCLAIDKLDTKMRDEFSSWHSERFVAERSPARDGLADLT